MKIKFLIIACFLFCTAAFGQAVLQPLGGNATLIEAHKKGLNASQKAQSVTAQFLPFSDDFSYFGPYPDAARWENSNSVFVNHTKATKPITIGVATFDGLKSDGLPYNGAYTSGSYPSDTLTSIPIRLDSLAGVNILPTDSVTLRFYYEARGIWEAPDNNEDLYLDFYSPTTGWSNGIWSKAGFNPGTNPDFNRVMISITDTTYLKNGFRFRFRNNSTACGDVDHWHIDAVYMDKKVAIDTITPEITFVKDMGSLLKNYSQMPFYQFTGAADMRTDISEYDNLRNNYNIGVNLTTFYQINDNLGNNVAQNTNGTNNLLPYATNGFCSDVNLINPSLNSFVYNGGTAFMDSTSYLCKFYATFVSDNYHTNDTIYYRQKFHNYFAYDDGSAEAGFGVNSPGGQVMAKYTLNKADTLRAIDIFFDPILYTNQLKNSTIRFRVLSHSGSVPDTLIFQDSLTTPFFSTPYNGFQRYQLNASVALAAGTTFYIGTIQTLSLSLNVGYDLNTDAHTNVLYNTGTGWFVSSFKGSIMMRPVFGDSARAVGVAQIKNPGEEILVYPNPATNEIFVKSISEINRVILLDLLGNTLLDEKGPHLDISSLPNGMYLIKALTEKGPGQIQKLLISR